MDIKVRRLMNSKYAEVTLTVNETTVDLGLFDGTDLQELAEKLETCVEDMQAHAIQMTGESL